MATKEPINNPEEQEWVDPYPKKRSWDWIYGILLIVVLYVLSVGPACKLAQKRVISWQTVDKVYKPLGAAADATGMDGLVQWYIRSLWGVVGD